MSKSAEERKDHCIKLHKFPHDFRFEIKKKSINEMDTTDAAKSQNLPPPSIKPKFTNFHFGHKSQKAFKNVSKKSNNNNPLESMNVDLAESLPEI